MRTCSTPSRPALRAGPLPRTERSTTERAALAATTGRTLPVLPSLALRGQSTPLRRCAPNQPPTAIKHSAQELDYPGHAASLTGNRRVVWLANHPPRRHERQRHATAAGESLASAAPPADALATRTAVASGRTPHPRAPGDVAAARPADLSSSPAGARPCLARAVRNRTDHPYAGASAWSILTKEACQSRWRQSHAASFVRRRREGLALAGRFLDGSPGARVPDGRGGQEPVIPRSRFGRPRPLVRLRDYRRPPR